jgi:predicted nucleic acid-binding protein
MKDVNITPGALSMEGHALRKLAHLLVGQEDGAIEGARKFLVEQALLEGKPDKSLADVAKNIQDIFYVQFSKAEVLEALQGLKSVLLFEKSGKYNLTPQREGELKKLNSETKASEKEIYHKWLEDVSRRYPKLSEDEKTVLVDDLKLYINKTFLLNGAEVGAFINGGVGEEIKAGDFDPWKWLPLRNASIHSIRRIEFPRFFRDADIDRREYFSRLLDGTFVYSIIQVDPDTLRVLRQSFKNYTFYLDTNILYSLFNLEDPRKSSSIVKAINLAIDYGIRIVISSKTLEEMKISIEYKSKLLLASPDIRRDLAEMGADLAEEENFITAYWRAYARTGVRKKDFIEKYKHIPELLKARRIDVINATYHPKNKLLNSEEALLRKFAPLKAPDIAEHDAYHGLLINWLRKEEDARGGKQRFWFLSWDTPVVNYAFATRKKGEQPFAILPHQLLQILRVYSHRTNDYDATFMDLFSKPQIKTAQGVLPNDFTEKVIAKISNYSDLPADLAIKILIDSEFTKEFINEPKEAVQDKALRMRVDKELIDRVNDLSGRVVSLEEDKGKVVKAKDELVKTTMKKDGKIANLELTVMMLLILLLAVANFWLCSAYWSKAQELLRWAWVITDAVLLFIILKIKCSIANIFIWVGVITGLILFLSWIVSLGRP